jgi:hypothetical protein
MKLRELRDQRIRLLSIYDRLAEQATRHSVESDRLRALYDGLRQIRFATQALHPEVANLEPLFLEMTSARPAQETIAFWRERLERELGQGRLRAEIIYAFGALLEERASQSDDDQEAPAADATGERARLITTMTAEPSVSLAREALDFLFASFSYTREEAGKALQTLVEQHLLDRIEPGDLDSVLERISDNPHRATATRAQARLFRHDDLLKKELADALTIMLDRIDEWDWPADGLASRAELTPSKWRLFIDDDLPTDCFLGILGARWQVILHQFLRDEQENRLRRLRQSVKTGSPAPQHVQYAGLSLIGETNLWAEAESTGDAERDTAAWIANSDISYWSVYWQRSQILGKLRDLQGLPAYGATATSGGMEVALTLINADIRLGRAAYPETPLTVVKGDLKDCYPTLPHDLVLEILTRFGLNDRQLAFFQRYVALPLQESGQVTRVRRGVPNEHALSDLLGELVLSMLDWTIQREARVEIVRLIDDICVIAPSGDEAVKAWQAMQLFCATFGLALNMEKCGSVCIGGARADGLPQGQPTWSLLNLDSQGEWNVAADAFDAYLERAREQISQQPSLLGQIEVYNNYLAYLLKALGARIPLGASHRDQVNQALLRVHQEFFGVNQGFVATLRSHISERFLERDSVTILPEAWFYWPITAGGCGLLHAPILAASYDQSYRKRQESQPPEERGADWQAEQRGWPAFYQTLLQEVKPTAPEPNQVMETLVKDFIARGSELSGGKQDKLSPYWRWILYIYGPQILESLGTFRYLISELVPLQLTTRKLGQSQSVDQEAAEDDIPF